MHAVPSAAQGYTAEREGTGNDCGIHVWTLPLCPASPTANSPDA